MRNVLAIVLAVVGSIAVTGSASAGDRTVKIRAIEGAYRVPMKFPDTGTVPDLTESRLQIFRCTDHSVYFFTELAFAADHQCSLSGIAESDKGALIYREDSCTLRIVADGKRIGFSDPKESCSSRCSARGHFDGIGFAMTSRRGTTKTDRSKIAAFDGEVWKRCRGRTRN